MNESLPILFVISEFRNPHAGTEGQLYQLVKNLDHKRFQPHLLVMTDSQYLKEGHFPCSYTVLGSRKVRSPMTWIRLLQVSLRFRWKGIRLAHCFLIDASLLCPPVFRLCGIRTIISRRDMGYWYSDGLLKALRLTGRFVSGVLTNSEAVADITHSKEGIARERISVLYNGVVDRSGDDRSQIPELASLKQQKAVIVMLVANIRPIKRIEDAIKAVAQLADHHSQLHLVILGGGDESDLRALANQKDVTDRVHFLGARSDVPACLHYADIGLLCSESEGFSNSIVEYMQQGIPVICTDAGGNPEAVTHGDTGFLYPVGDVGALAGALEILLMNEGERRTLGDRARAEAHARFSVQQMVDGHQGIYSSILGRCSNSELGR